MRIPYFVIMKIKNEIPIDADYDRGDLSSIIDSAKYQAPESKWIWGRINDFVNELVPYPPVEDWHKKVVNILLDEEKY